MNYLPRNRNKSPYLKKILILVSIFLAGALLFSLLDTPILRMVSPLWQAENAFSKTLRGTWDFFHTRNSLVAENTRLTERVASLERELSSISLEKDRQTFLSELGRFSPGSGVLASILTTPPQSPYDLIVIDVGGRDGVTSGARVALPEGPVVGVVAEVFERFSRVKLYSTPNEKTNAVLERHEVPVVLEGAGGGNFIISLPRDTEVVAGDRIISSDLEAKLLAVVEDVRLEPTDAFKEVRARGPANIFTIRFVTILP